MLVALLFGYLWLGSEVCKGRVLDIHSSKAWQVGTGNNVGIRYTLQVTAAQRTYAGRGERQVARDLEETE